MNERDNDKHNGAENHGNGNHEVGYGKPPKHSQFKPGNPGRPKGFKKSSLSLPEIISEAMSQRRKVRRGDRIVSMSVAQIFVERLVGMATTGSPIEMTKVLALIAKHAPNLLAAPELEARITFHRAPGSEVQLPPADLWKDPRK